MAQSIQQLQQQLQVAEKELESVGNKLAGAAVGASVVRGPLGAVVGAFTGREQGKKDALVKQISQIKDAMRVTEAEINRLKARETQLVNDYQNQRFRKDDEDHQRYNALEKQKYSEQDPQKLRALELQLSTMQRATTDRQLREQREHELAVADIHRQIQTLS